MVSAGALRGAETMTGRIAIIGTAGRRDDAARLSREIYDRMYACTLEAIEEWGTAEAVSGLAAYADHLAVRAFLDGKLEALDLRAPAHWDVAGKRFVPNPAIQFNPGRTLNSYHQAFGRVVGIDPFDEIARAFEMGATLTVAEGFHRRNKDVADLATHMLAFTFGDDVAPVDVAPDDPGFRSSGEAGLKDGGTADTWRSAWRCDAKRHVSLTWLATAPAPQGRAP